MWAAQNLPSSKVKIMSLILVPTSVFFSELVLIANVDGWMCDYCMISVKMMTQMLSVHTKGLI